MKTRNGFVSNSSSSSFIIAIPLDSYEDMFMGMNDLEKKVIEELVVEQKVVGVKCKFLSYATGNDRTIYPDNDLSEELLYEMISSVTGNDINISEDIEDRYDRHEQALFEILDGATGRFSGNIKLADNGFYSHEYY
jgi:hypothetical protein